MNIKAVIHEKYKEMEIHVCNQEMSPEVSNTISELGKFLNTGITVIASNGERIVLQEKDVCRFYAQDAKVFAQTQTEKFVIPQKLYEIENHLDKTRFLRISKSEIINLKKITRVDLSLLGTIKVCLVGEIETFTSRRNVTKLKSALGL